MHSGGSGFSRRPVIEAPMRDSGFTIRPIGRRRRYGSPVTIVTNGWAARIPDPIRIVVPEFPASMTSWGSASPRIPRPVTRRSVGEFSRMSTPSASIIPTVRSVSSPGRKPLIRLNPSASEASITARWLIDLSPGTATVPETLAVFLMSEPVPRLLGLPEIGQEARGVAAPDEPLEKGEVPPVVPGRPKDLLPVLEDDVLPHLRVARGDAREVAESPRRVAEG